MSTFREDHYQALSDDDKAKARQQLGAASEAATVDDMWELCIQISQKNSQGVTSIQNALTNVVTALLMLTDVKR